MKKILVLLILISLSGIIFGQTLNTKSANQILKERGEIYFKFELNEEFIQKTLTQISKIISIDDVSNNVVTAYANRKEFSNFIELGIDYTILIAPSLLHKPVCKDFDAIRSTNDWDFYPTYQGYLDMMNQFVIDYPNLCEVVNIGSTLQDRDLLFIHINNNIGVTENEPQFMYTSSIHGDEITAYVLMLRYIDYLLQNYGTNPDVTNMVNNIDIWINPLANPDGTYAMGN
ncbi:MAG: M14 family zinc carboxypeptidase, partial [Bacteroidota bacterium]